MSMLMQPDSITSRGCCCCCYHLHALRMAVHQCTCWLISPVSLTHCPGRDSGRLPPTNLQYCWSPSLPSANGLFRSLVPASGTVFHHMWPLHSRDIQTASWNIALSPVKSGPDHLICWLLCSNVDRAIIVVVSARPHDDDDDDDDDDKPQ